jgi:iron(III) transport system permease protein
VDTFTTGIFTAWFAFSNPQAAIRLSAWLMIFVLLLLATEKYQRRKLRYNIVGSSHRPARITRLYSWNAALALLICSIPFLFGFLLPAFMLVYWSIITAPIVVNYRFWELLYNSFLLAGLASVTVVVFAVLISWSVRIFPMFFMKFLARVSTLGYALPGAVVAIGILVPFLWIDARLAPIGGQGVRIALTGTWFALIYAYLVRFMAVGYNSIESGLEKIPRSMDDASRSLGRSNIRTLWSINLPLVRASVVSAALLVFIDVLKELPLTLILRPFNFDTLAIRAFEFASDERVAEAAPAALVIILVGMIPVVILNKLIEGKNHDRS